ncbi:PAS domain-containing protein [uncultured Parvibaculum sp.]|uniref:PAS domain-containing protein n=1 Tax=uncultured Parvibaculum sp. TaxID=291828 RepID=UPI0030DA7781
MADLSFEIGHSRDFLSYWQSLRQDGEIPHARQVNPGKIKELLPDLIIFEVLEDGTVRYRLTGTRVMERTGLEPTGKSLQDMVKSEFNEMLAFAFQSVVSLKIGIVSHFTNYYRGGHAGRMEVVILPLRAPESDPPRVICHWSRDPEVPDHVIGIERMTDRIDDATVFDLGFGLPDESLVAAFRV